MRFRRAIVAVVAITCLPLVSPLPTVAGASAVPTGALGGVGTLTTSQTSQYRNWNWANPDPVYQYAAADGELAIVKYDSTRTVLTVDEYDPATAAPAGIAQRTISLAGWPDWGGFYAAPDGHFYVLVGRDNPNEDDNLTVVAVRRYDASWNLVGTAYVTGGVSQGVKGIYTPFDAGAPHMDLVGNRLVVHMSRLIYAIDNVHHQVNLTFEVAIDTMTATTFQQLGGYAYSSHSFQQLLTTSGSNLVVVDHGDAYPRQIQMGVMANYPASRTVKTYDLFDFNGATGNNFTGASLTGLVSGPQGVVVLGNSIPQPNAPNGTLGTSTQNRNIFAVSADPATGAHTVHWLTTFAAGGADTALEPRVVQIAADRFAVLFGVRSGSTDSLEYRLIDSAGRVLAAKTFAGVFHASISDPVLIGNSVEWVGIAAGSATPAPAYLYGLDVRDPAAPVLGGSSPATTSVVPGVDFTGDGKADVAVYRPSTHQWLVRGQATVTFGADGDDPVPADYTGDGKADVAVYRPSTHQWLVQGQPAVTFGADGDIPVPADYTGDGKADVAVYRPSTHRWYVRGQKAVKSGATGDVPVPGDYTGDGATDVATFRPSNHRWYVRGRPSVAWGATGDVPVPGDYTGDGATDVAVFRPASHEWLVPGQATVTLGADGDVAVPADYTGDGKADAAVYRPSTHQWLVGGQAAITFGADGDVPL